MAGLEAVADSAGRCASATRPGARTAIMLTAAVANRMYVMGGTLSEVELGSNLNHARGQNLLRVQPGIAVPRIESKNRARVEHVVEVDHSLHAGSSHPEDPGEA